MAADKDVLTRALRDLNVNLASMSEFTLKAEQESTMIALLAGRAVLAVFPTGYSKSLIWQMFVHVKNYKTEQECVDSCYFAF